MPEPITGHEYLMMLKEQGKKGFDSFETLFHQIDLKARKNGVPVSGQFELTPLCNFDCRMCYTHLTKQQMGGRPLLTVDQWKELMHAAWEAGMVRVNLTGGECLSYPGFEELYLYLHSLGCEIRVLTNGALLDEKWIRFFLNHPPILIQISLYGGDEETYERVTGHRAFSVVSTNIRRAAEAGFPLAVAVTPSRYMEKGVLETVNAAFSFGVPVSIAPALFDPKEETGRSGQDHELSPDEYVEVFRLRNQLEGREIPPIDPAQLPEPGGPCHECSVFGLNCGGGMSCFDIDWDGTMRICNTCRDVVSYPLKEGFLPAWKKIHDVAASWPRVPECMDCPYETVCTNCEIRKSFFNGPGKQPLELCERTRYLVSHGVYTIPECE